MKRVVRPLVLVRLVRASYITAKITAGNGTSDSAGGRVEMRIGGGGTHFRIRCADKNGRRLSWQKTEGANADAKTGRKYNVHSVAQMDAVRTRQGMLIRMGERRAIGVAK